MSRKSAALSVDEKSTLNVLKQKILSSIVNFCSVAVFESLCQLLHKYVESFHKLLCIIGKATNLEDLINPERYEQ